MEYLIYDAKCIIFAVLCISIYIAFDKKTNKILLIDIIMMAILVIVSGIRCNFGSDMFNYYNQYNMVNIIYENVGEIINTNYQCGFPLLCYIVYKLTHFEYAIFWVIALFTYPTMIIYMRKKTEKPSLAFATYLLMGFFVMSNNILKQNIAMVILIIAYYSFLKKKKYIGYILLVYLASIFHITAIIGGILIFVGTKIHPTYKNLIRFIIAGIILYFSYSLVLPKIMSYIPVFLRYEGYINMEVSTTSAIRGTINVISYIIMYIILTCVLIKNKEKIKELSENNNYSYEQISFLIIAIMISIIAIRGQTINRIGIYLYQFIIFIIPKLFELKYTNKAKKQYLSLIIILFITWFCLNNIVGAENRYYNYTTYFNDTPKSYY